MKAPQSDKTIERKIERSFRRKAKHLKGEKQKRNKAWRILETERRLFGDDCDQW